MVFMNRFFKLFFSVILLAGINGQFIAARPLANNSPEIINSVLTGSVSSINSTLLKEVGPSLSTNKFPAFTDFVTNVSNGKPNQIVGVYVENVLALRVVQQINPEFVSLNEGEATQYALANAKEGNIGLLAHQALSGVLFNSLKKGDIVQIIYGNSVISRYEVTEIKDFQAYKADDPTSNFIDLSNHSTLTSTSLFYHLYGGDKHVTFQTCITRNNHDEWGLHFVIATPIS